MVFPHRRTREPRRHLRRQLVHRHGIAHGRIRRARQQVIIIGIIAVPHDRAARKTRQLRCHGVHNLLLIGTALQHAVGLEHHLRAAVAGGGLRQARRRANAIELDTSETANMMKNMPG